jgi:hypothetical protein
MKDWPGLKFNKDLYPNGHIPIAVINGERQCETNSICRFIARYTGFYPEYLS